MDPPRPASTVDDRSYAAEHGTSLSTTATHKRQRSGDDGPPTKKAKQTVEEPQQYSDSVRRKLASTSRTGQACDRCKERKMKCDTDPQACQPCRQKNLRCFTTDRVTGQSRERGQTDRTETELQYLRDQYTAYQKKYGPLQPTDVSASRLSSASESSKEKNQYLTQQSYGVEKGQLTQGSLIPSSQYVGWPVPDHVEPLQHGPMNGTVVDILDGYVDIADFECEMMEDPTQLNVFNVSRASILNTTTGHQTITDPRLPPKDEALRDVNSFLVIVSQFVPIVHGPSFINLVNRIYDQPGTTALAEQVQLVVVLGIVSFQAAVRNHQQAAEKFEQSHYWIHYGLTWYRDLLRDRSLAAMQALALLAVHFRNLPKPGDTWTFAHNLLVKAMELEYHRDPDRIKLLPGEDNALCKELRKRVFHTILGICITTGCRVSKPAPWQFQHWDVPLPAAVMDAEISEHGFVQNLSGRCDFWSCIQLAKLLPLLTEMYNYVISVRRPEAEYLQIVEALHTKLDAWRHDWDILTKQDEGNISVRVATLLMETWAAEYTLNLYHPSLCPQLSPENMDRHIEICHKQAQRLLKNFHILSSKYKGVDFTWHSTAAYALGFGITLHVYHQRKGKLTQEQFEAMRNELKGWLSLVAYADLVMRTGNHLQHVFEPRVSRLEKECRNLLTTTQNDQRSHNQTPITSGNGTPGGNFAPSTVSPYPPSLLHVSTESDIGSSSTQSIRTPMAFSPHTTSAQSWQAPSSIPYMQNSTATSTFTNYNTLPGPYQPVSTSLAPLLNGTSSGYVNYRPAPSIPQHDTMIFAPNHYSEEGNMAWPMMYSGGR